MPPTAIIDQTGRKVQVEKKPRRIISLVPSLTELLFDLGLDEEIIGLTKFCVHPGDRVRNKTLIGGTKNIKTQKIAALEPDLIIANKEENVKKFVSELIPDFPTYISDIDNLEQAFEAIEHIGKLTGREKESKNLLQSIKIEFERLEKNKTSHALKAAYLIWKDPYMTVGGDTFISSMMEKAGFTNVFQNEKRYPSIGLDTLKEVQPDLIFLSSEPYPFKENHVAEFQNEYPLSKTMVVDGEMFSWYGSRMKKAPSYFLNLREKIKG